ncbi:isochorismatase family protein [Microtetraspora malaysiensis]|uniref:isochorismatase family protein n=1 Tax=Microtetraspora malaysiensis TaxID=161358 RepID=UPI003D90AFD0
MREIDTNAALIVIDVQKGFEDAFWGRRDNPDAEKNIAALIRAWRAAERPVVLVQHATQRTLDEQGQLWLAFDDSVRAVLSKGKIE